MIASGLSACDVLSERMLPAGGGPCAYIPVGVLCI